MATVYVGMDLRLDRRVAVKVLRPGLAADESFAARFRREARSAAQLNHPNVVSVFDQGHEGADMFLVMELVPGRSLREILRLEGALHPRAALDILDSVLCGLGAAHDAGLIHRDIKPENVILDEQNVKVADFGLARAVTTQTMTAQSGVLLGTAAYLSPEQVEHGFADARSDVYSAGLVLFEMLTGTKAVNGENPIHVAYQHVHGSIPAPSTLVPGLAPELDGLVAYAAARNPDERPDDAGALLTHVRRTRALLSTAELDLRPTPEQPGVADQAPVATVAVDRTTALPMPSQSEPTSAILTPGPGTAVAAREAGPPPPRRRGRWVAVALAAVLALGAVWFFVQGPGATATVPTVAGLEQAAALEAIETSGLRADVNEAFSEDVAKGLVITVDPTAGTETGKGSTVVLEVSKGPERYTVPTLVGTKASGAKAALDGVNLDLGETTEKFDEEAPKGQVLSQAPAAGQSVKKGTNVAIVVSKGRRPITVPNVVGKPADESTEALKALGLEVARGEAVNSDDVPQGSIVSQKPAKGTLFRGDTVTIVVSKGPVLVEVPGVVGRQRAEARQILVRAGFTVRINEVLGGFFGTVRSQDPAAGTPVPKGSTITLTVV